MRVSLDRPNMYYDVGPHTNIGNDFKPLVETLLAECNKAKHAVIYCRSLNTVADIYAHFLYTLGNNNYHPHASECKLLGTFHANSITRMLACKIMVRLFALCVLWAWV